MDKKHIYIFADIVASADLPRPVLPDAGGVPNPGREGMAGLGAQVPAAL